MTVLPLLLWACEPLPPGAEVEGEADGPPASVVDDPGPESAPEWVDPMLGDGSEDPASDDDAAPEDPAPEDPAPEDPAPEDLVEDQVPEEPPTPSESAAPPTDSGLAEPSERPWGGSSSWDDPTDAYVTPGTDPNAPSGEVATTPTSDPGRMVPSSDGNHAYVVDDDLGAILVFDLVGETVVQVPVGLEPTRIVRHDDEVFVTLRAEGAVAVLDEVGGTLVLRDVVPVGAEPVGLDWSELDGRLLVALSMEDAVVSLDGTTLEEVERWEVPGEPHWVIAAPDVHPDSVAWAVTAGHPGVHHLGHDGGRTLQELPEMPRYTVAGCPDRLLQPRVTGDPVYDGWAGVIWLAAVYVDTTLVEDPPAPSNCTPLPPAVTTQAYYSQPPPPNRPGVVARLNPALVSMPVDLGPGEARAVAAERPSYGGVGFGTARTWPSSVRLGWYGVSPMVYVTMPGAAAVVTSHRSTPTTESIAPFSGYRRSATTTPAGAIDLLPAPAGASGELWVWCAEARVMSRTSTRQTGSTHHQSGWSDYSRTEIAAPTSPLPMNVLNGRALFRSGTETDVTDKDAGTTCDTCHTGGRSDGLTWFFPDFPRQPPPLFEGLADSAPFTWLGGVDTVAHEAMLTSAERMGGTGLSEAQAADVAAYLATIRAPIGPEGDPVQIAAGEAVFNDPVVGCATCHSGSEGTDNATHWIFGLAGINTPRLTGIAATSPYFHDGSAATLRDVIDRAENGEMGMTGHLTEEDKDALEAYLRSL